MTTEQTPPQGEQTPPPATPQAQNDQQPAAIPYDRFKQVNDALKAATDKLTALEKVQSAKQQSETDLATRLQAIESDLTKERATNLRLSVANAKGLPRELVDRLRGDDQAALESDADALLALVKKVGPGVPPPGGVAQKIDIQNMSPADIRKARAEGKL